MQPPEPGPQRVLVEILAELLMYEARHLGTLGQDWRAEAQRQITRGYRLIGYAEAPQGIQCLRCGLTSWNAHDIAQRYCAYCRRFHEGGS